MKDIILVCNLFNENNGSYATFGENIVHETINFFKSDDNNIYIYIPPSGRIGNEYISKKGKGKEDIDITKEKLSLLLTCGYGNNTLKVIYYVEDLEYVKDYGENIHYGNKSLKEIFENNRSVDGEKDRYMDQVTFKTKKIKKPTDTILLTNHKDESTEGIYYFEKKLRNQSMKCYFKTDNDNENDSKSIRELINETVWEDFDLPKVKDYTPNSPKLNFFNIIRKEDDELAFSNMFEYFFTKYPEWFIDFLSSTTKIRLKKDFIIEREKNRIDLYVTDGDTRIIIENKIKSGINGIKKGTKESQLSKYIDSIIEDDKVTIENKPRVANSLKCLILRPEYASLQRYSEFMTYNYKKDNINIEYKYEEISYKQIHEFYKKKEGYVAPDDKLFFSLFIKAMEKHTKKTDTDIEDRMKARFVNRIDFLKKGKNTKS